MEIHKKIIGFGSVDVVSFQNTDSFLRLLRLLSHPWFHLQSLYRSSWSQVTLCPGIRFPFVTTLWSIWHIPCLLYFILLQVNIWYKENPSFMW